MNESKSRLSSRKAGSVVTVQQVKARTSHMLCAVQVGEILQDDQLIVDSELLIETPDQHLALLFHPEHVYLFINI